MHIFVRLTIKTDMHIFVRHVIEIQYAHICETYYKKPINTCL